MVPKAMLRTRSVYIALALAGCVTKGGARSSGPGPESRVPVLTEEARDARKVQAKADTAARAELDARTVDRVQPGLESDEARHKLEQKGSDAGRFEGRLSRSAFWGNGEFSYVLKLPASGPSALRFECWGGESRHHRFEIFANGEKIATQTLFDDAPGETLPVEHVLPERLTKGRAPIRIAFRPAPDGSIGAIFDVRIVRPAASTPR